MLTSAVLTAVEQMSKQLSLRREIYVTHTHYTTNATITLR